MHNTLSTQAVDSLGSGGIGAISRLVGIDEWSARRGLEAAIPAVLAAMIARVSTRGGSQLYDGIMSRQRGIDAEPVMSTEGLPLEPRLLDDRGGIFVRDLLGAREDSIARGIGEHAGVNRDNAGRLLHYGAGALVATIGAIVARRGLELRGFEALLRDERANVTGALPASLRSLAPGVTPVESDVARERLRVTPMPAEMHPFTPTPSGVATSHRSSWLVPAALLGILAVGGLGVWGLAKNNAGPTVASIENTGNVDSTKLPKGLDSHMAMTDAQRRAADDASSRTHGVAPPAINAPAPVALGPTLPAIPSLTGSGDSGYVLGSSGVPEQPNARGGGPEAGSAAMQQPSNNEQNAAARDATAPIAGAQNANAPSTNFGPLEFDFATVNLTASSRPHFDQLVQVMTSNPTARVRLVGHTDSVGNPDANQRLSERRADRVRDMLVERGVDGSRIEATSGSAANQPIGSNAQNRRTDVLLSP